MNRPAEHKPETILTSAVAVFRDQGVQASTAQIAAAAGVSNGTLFNYFPTKQDLIDALYISIKADLARAVGEIDDSLAVEAQTRTVWNRWLSWTLENRDAHAVMNLLSESGLASDAARVDGLELIKVPMGVLQSAHESGVLVDLPLPYLATLVQRQLDLAVIAELNDNQREVAFHVLWNGITHSPRHTMPMENHQQ